MVSDRLTVHRRECPAPAIRRLREALRGWTEDDLADDPLLIRLIDRLDPEGRERAGFIHARTTLFLSKEVNPAPLKPLKDWEKALKRLLEGDPMTPKLKVRVSEQDQQQGGRVTSAHTREAFDAWAGPALGVGLKVCLSIFNECSLSCVEFIDARSPTITFPDWNVRGNNNYDNWPFVFGLDTSDEVKWLDGFERYQIWAQKQNQETLWLQSMSKDVRDSLERGYRTDKIPSTYPQSQFEKVLERYKSLKETASKLGNARHRSLPFNNLTTNHITTMQSQFPLVWLALNEALRVPCAVRCPDGSVLLNLGGAIFARILVRLCATAAETPEEAHVRGGMTWLLNDTNPAWMGDKAFPFERPVYTHVAGMNERVQSMLGVMLPQGIWLAGHGLRADITFQASPFVVGAPTPPIMGSLAVAESLRQEEESRNAEHWRKEQARRNDD